MNKALLDPMDEAAETFLILNCSNQIFQEIFDHLVFTIYYWLKILNEHKQI